MLVNTKKMLNEAKKYSYAIPSPDFINQNMIKAYIEVAEELKVPALISISEGLSKYMCLEEAFAISKYYAEKTHLGDDILSYCFQLIHVIRCCG